MTASLKDQAVVVAVYVERPRRRLPSKQQQQLRREAHICSRFNINSTNGGSGKGNNRKAELLDYSRRLRESAQSSGSSSPSNKPALLPPVSSHDYHHQPVMMTKIATIESKTKPSKIPTCLGSCKFSFSSILKFLTVFQFKKERNKTKKKNNTGFISNKMKAAIEVIAGAKRKQFCSKSIGKITKSINKRPMISGVCKGI